MLLLSTYHHTRLTESRIQKDTIYIGWKHPHMEWIKLNRDRAYKGSMNIAGCGSLFGDSYGQWLQGYTQKIGACDALHAEIWEMYT